MSNMGISRTALDWIIYTDYEEKRGYRYHFLSSISIHVELIVNLLGRRVVSVAALFCRNCDFAVENNDSISSNLTIFNHHTFSSQGTKMVFAGIKKPQERQNLIAYLKASCEA